MSSTAVTACTFLDVPVASKFCLACEYVASCAALTTTARVTVGPHPYKQRDQHIIIERNKVAKPVTLKCRVLSNILHSFKSEQFQCVDFTTLVQEKLELKNISQSWQLEKI